MLTMKASRELLWNFCFNRVRTSGNLKDLKTQIQNWFETQIFESYQDAGGFIINKVSNFDIYPKISN